ncbi:unnamed protein product [Discosporangium mesarthrocarpum]
MSARVATVASGATKEPVEHAKEGEGEGGDGVGEENRERHVAGTPDGGLWGQVRGAIRKRPVTLVRVAWVLVGDVGRSTLGGISGVRGRCTANATIFLREEEEGKRVLG